MKVGLDTSVILRLLVGEPEDQASRAQAFLDELTKRGDIPVVSDLVIAETYFACQYHYEVPKKEALEALRQLFEDGEIESLGVAPSVLKTENLATAKPGFVDRLIQQQYQNETAGMVSFEKASGRLPSVRVL